LCLLFEVRKKRLCYDIYVCNPIWSADFRHLSGCPKLNGSNMAAREVLAYRVASRINWKAFTSAHTALLVETALRSGIDAWKSLLNGGISTDQALQVRKVICEVCVV
jgi:hypothetical protein